MSIIGNRFDLFPLLGTGPLLRTLRSVICLFSLIAAFPVSADEPEKAETLVVFKPSLAALMIENGRTDVEKVFFDVPSKYLGRPVYIDGEYAIGFAFKLPWPSEVPLLPGHDGELRGAVNWAKPRSGLTLPEIGKLEDWPHLVGMQAGLEIRDNGEVEAGALKTAYFLPNTDPLASGAIVCKGADDSCRLSLRTRGFYTLDVRIPRRQIEFWPAFARAVQGFVAGAMSKSEAIETMSEATPAE